MITQQHMESINMARDTVEAALAAEYDYPPNSIPGTHNQPQGDRENYDVLIANYTLYTVKARNRDEAEQNALKEEHVIAHKPKGREVV